MNLEFGLLMTVIGVISVFSSLAVVAMTCVVLKRLFRREVTREGEAYPPEELEQRKRTGARNFRIKLNDEEHEVEVQDMGAMSKGFEDIEIPSGVGEELKVSVGDVEYEVNVEQLGETEPAAISTVKKRVRTAEKVEKAKEVVVAPMPGAIVKVPVMVGDEVEKGDVVIVLETIKMENSIQTTVSGVVREIRVAEGDSVEAGDVLVVID